jgi:hypothetical protein
VEGWLDGRKAEDETDEWRGYKYYISYSEASLMILIGEEPEGW